jgi:hypothetical protein
MTELKARIEKLPKVRREKIKARAAALIAEEMSIRDPRRSKASQPAKR